MQLLSKKKKATEQIEEALEEPVITIPLTHINEIEDPQYRKKGKRVEFDAVVGSTPIPYSAPSELLVDDRPEEIKEGDPINLELVGIPSETKYRRLLRKYGEDSKIEEQASRTIYRIRFRPRVLSLERIGNKIVDEKGHEYKTYDIYVVTDKRIKFQPASLVHLVGFPRPEPRSQRITLQATEASFPDDTQFYDKNQINRLRQFFAHKTVKERINWILEAFASYSKVVGRENVALACLLAYCSPIWVVLDNERQRGWALVLVIGDTTTGKSETVRKLISLLQAGMLVTAETASTVGLTGTATQIEREGWFVEWGLLVLNDHGLLAIDGSQKLSSSQWAVLAESERSGIVAITKAAKDQAYAQTRQIKLANPVNPESDKYSTKALIEFLYPVQSVGTILDATSIARIDLAVFADGRDVGPEQINKVSEKLSEEDRKHLEGLRHLVKWTWTDKAQVDFTPEALQRLLHHATSLHDRYFTQDIPLASIDLKWKLARLASALAFLTLSADDELSTVTVTEDHVQIIVDFLDQEYTKAGLGALAQTERCEVLSQEELEIITHRVGEKAKLNPAVVNEILAFIVVKAHLTKDQIKQKFALADNNQLRPLLAELRNEGLISVGKGIYPTAQLIQAYKTNGLNTINMLNTDRKEPPTTRGEEIHPSFSAQDKGDNQDKPEEPKKSITQEQIELVLRIAKELDQETQLSPQILRYRVSKADPSLDFDSIWGVLTDSESPRVTRDDHGIWRPTK
jgi:hypothetical protein